MSSNLKSDVPETCYEIVFTGTCNRERKVRRHTFGVTPTKDGKWRVSTNDYTGYISTLENVLRFLGAKTGKWVLTSYVALLSEYEADGEIKSVRMRPLFDVSTKCLAQGELTK